MARKAWIYRILNKVNQKSYVGSSVDVSARWTDHRYKLRLRIHVNQKLQRAYDKYGVEAFEYSKLAICEISQRAFQEAYYSQIYDVWDNGYNITKIDLETGNNVVAEETKAKISKAGKGRKVSEETKQKLSESNAGQGLGSKHSQATKDKMIKSRTGKVQSEETKRKLSDAAKAQHARCNPDKFEETKKKISSSVKASIAKKS